jgi:hypothetical protein
LVAIGRQAVPGRTRGSARLNTGKSGISNVPGRTRGSALAAGRACRGLVRISGCGQAAVAAGVVSVGQCSVTIAGKRCQAEDETRDNALVADRACCGLVRISGCGQQGERRAVLGGDRRQAVPGRRRGSALAADRACCGLVRVSGYWPWCSVTGSSSGSSFSRLVKPAERRRRRQCRAVLGGDRLASGARSKTRQRTGGRSGLLWPGQALGLRAARRASGGAWWRSPASGARSKTRQRTGCRSGLLWPGQALGLRSARRASGGAWWRSPASGARSKTRQRTGCRSGLLWPGQALGLRSARRASGGARWRSAGKRC